MAESESVEDDEEVEGGGVEEDGKDTGGEAVEGREPGGVVSFRIGFTRGFKNNFSH